MNLSNTWKIKFNLVGYAVKEYMQYIEADCMDSAIEKAKNSFEFRLLELRRKRTKKNISGIEAQRLCKYSKVKNDLVVSFGSGHSTIYKSNINIFDTINKAIERHNNAFKNFTGKLVKVDNIESIYERV